MQAPALFCGSPFACFGGFFLVPGPALSHPSAHGLATTLAPVFWWCTAIDADISKENRKWNIISLSVSRNCNRHLSKKKAGATWMHPPRRDWFLNLAQFTSLLLQTQIGASRGRDIK